MSLDFQVKTLWIRQAALKTPPCTLRRLARHLRRPARHRSAPGPLAGLWARLIALSIFALSIFRGLGTPRTAASLAAGLCVLGCAAASPGAAAAAAPLVVRVVVVATWETTHDGQDGTGELHAWLTRWPLKKAIAFPVGAAPLHYDPQSHVLAIVTGMATARASASIMALGLDRRFDLRRAYWIVAGTAGVDPAAASAGSAAWSRWVVDGDLTQEIDPREAPGDWSTGVVPYERTAPFQTPPPPAHSADANVAYRLNPGLVDWAFALSRGVTLKDDAVLAKLRAPYAGVGAAPPFVLEGEGLMSARTWYGDRLNDWAERWVSYWTAGQGRFVMSAEEDSGVMQALTFLSQGGKVDLERVLILRAASDYTVPPPGVSAADFLARETTQGFPANKEALDALYVVASPVVRYLTEHWRDTRDRPPGAMRPASAKEAAHSAETGS